MAVTVDWLVGSVVHGSHGGGHRGVQDGGVGHGVGVGVVPDVGAGGGQDSGDTEEGLVGDGNVSTELSL